VSLKSKCDQYDTLVKELFRILAMARDYDFILTLIFRQLVFFVLLKKY